VTGTVRPAGRVHIVGAGPVGLFLTALLQSVDGQAVRLYERRREYTRTRMVSLAEYLVADSVESYKSDLIDGQDVEAIFEPADLQAGLVYRRSIAPDLQALLAEWTRGFVPLNTVEETLSALIDSRGGSSVERILGDVAADEAIAWLEPGDILIDCTGAKSLTRDLLLPGGDGEVRGWNTKRFRLEYALVVTFLYGQPYACNEYCKYYKNIDNRGYKFIPAVHRTYYDGAISHVTGIISISEGEFQAMPPSFDGAWLREQFPDVAQSMDRFIDKVKEETNGELIGDLEIMRIPLDVYRARNFTSRPWRRPGLDGPLTDATVFLAGDAAIGSPYFQSISLGLECAAMLASLLGDRTLAVGEMFDRYEAYMYQQWLRVYMRTQMIKHNKDLLESVDNTFALLQKLHVF
jgi:2-polyprenyl-6-methoxyphenol hydroxylase-like FAD-dependent oxidoreductase